jgi:transposase
MAMGKRERHRQEALFVCTADLRPSPAHPYYQVVNALLEAHGFDAWVEQVCQPFYAPVMGRPSLAPSVYFRCLLIGYFEGIDSERGIAWRVADSLSLRRFLGIGLEENTPDHSTLSRTRRLIDLETHQRVFIWVLKLLALRNLLDGKTAGVDATTLEANAALRSIVRKDSGQNYTDFLTELAKASGIETPTREDLARLDKQRKHKASNQDWQNPHDPDARITKMKDGRTHLAHKDEHAVDMSSGAVVAVTLQPADEGDTTTWRQTVEVACQNLNAVASDPVTAAYVQEKPVQELVEDKGYHSNETMTDYREIGIRSYVAEPQRGRRQWEGQTAARDAVYANRRRIRGKRGKELMRKRGELIERSFAHCYETGGMRRTHLRGHHNILKRLLVHVAGFNLSLVLRQLLPRGTPRGLQDLGAAARAALVACGAAVGGLGTALGGLVARFGRLGSLGHALGALATPRAHAA